MIHPGPRPTRFPSPPRSRRRAALSLGVLALLAASAALAARLLYLARDEELCDDRGAACLDATLTYDVNARLLWLRGRIESAPGPGLLTIVVRGTSRLGHVRYAPLEVELRGRRSEIVDHRTIPDHPDVENWTIHRVTFEPAPAE